MFINQLNISLVKFKNICLRRARFIASFCMRKKCEIKTKEKKFKKERERHRLKNRGKGE